jgi:CHAT domain/Tetratricopeptide Repeats-Sensor
MAVANWGDDRFGSDKAVRSARLSCLLIGTGAGGMNLNDSMRALLRGVKAANDRLIEAGFDDKVLLDELEFLELYQDAAIQAARDLDRVLMDGDMVDSFDWNEHTVTEGQGGCRRVVFEEAPCWWQRLEIIYDNKRDELRFIALTDKARAEESLVAGQMRLAEDFVREAEASTGENEEVARTLFEMLLPNRFKEMAPDQYDVVLVVDEVSARFPWEMLQDGWSVNGKPLSVAAGMLRQLKTPTYRAHPTRPFGKTAYVVGNPKLPPQAGGMQFPDLPGAAKEAQEVATLLGQSGFEVIEQINARARDILINLHGKAYRILHLAGHGIHEEQVTVDEGVCPACDQPLPELRKLVSGMVIGKDVYLTPGDVEQMRWVPDLVFINCCHLGSTTSTNPAWSRYSALAANLATQFINMGVKAVVAAGWAVDDAAARQFAVSFYDRMLKGEGFGKAVQAARAEVYEQFPGVNTWGAYQCYGDPDYRLDDGHAGGGWEEKPYRAPAEVVADLENQLCAIRMGWAGTTDVAEQGKRVAAMLERIPTKQRQEWLKRADINTALGLVYGEMANMETAGLQRDTALLDQAINALSVAIAAEQAEMPVRALEQRANFRVKRALQRWLAERGKAKARPRRSRANAPDASVTSDLEEAIRDLEALVRMAGTAERFSLLGSAYKRAAWMQTEPTAVINALTNMANNYLQAFALASENKLDPYPLTNWVSAEAMLDWFKGEREAHVYRNRIPGWCDQAVSDAAARQQTDPDFWNSVVEADCKLSLTLEQGRLDEATVDEVVAGYRQAMERGSSPRERGSVLEQLEFLLDMAQRAGKTDIARTIGEIRQQLV